MRPFVDGLVRTLAIADNTVVVFLTDIIHPRRSLSHELVLRFGDDNILDADGD